MDSAQKKKAHRKKAKKITAEYLHNAGLYYLQRFAASQDQFRKIMLRKVRRSCLEHKEQDYKACAELVEILITKFERAGLLNDDMFAKAAVTSLRRRGKSKKSIILNLRARGIPAPVIHEKLDSLELEKGLDGDLAAALMLLRRKKVGPFDIGKNMTAEKTLAALARAGFSYETAQEALKMKREDAEDILKN